MRLVKSSEIQEMDRITIEEMGVPGVVLMENAARGATRAFLDHFSPPSGSHALVLCGRGNNGGDGYAIARYLHQAGVRVTVIVLAETARIGGDALLNLEVIKRMRLNIIEAADREEWNRKSELISTCDYIVDGILGTGLNAPVHGMYEEIIEAVNRSQKPVMAVDIPSGLNADTGQVMGAAVRADLTVTFGFPKAGQLVYPGAELVGRLVCINIGIPNEVADRIPITFSLIVPDDFKDLLVKGAQNTHKGNRGHLLILAGSIGKTGAASLTALGALRGGAGLVTLGTPESLNAILEEKLTEAMTVPLPATSEGSLSLQAEEQIIRLMDGKTAVAIGPGLSTHSETTALVRRIVSRCSLPMVIDADGLNALAGDVSVLENCRGRAILTPHPGEMGRLSGLTNRDVQADRLGNASRFAKQHQCILVLKGARTVVAQPEGRTYINPTGNPALSSGGSGDVLTGLIGGYLARGSTATKAALAGVFLHGLAADFLGETMGQAGILAGELPGVVPPLMAFLGRGEWPLKSPPPCDDLCQPL
jgi:NAD(P)H-hydrate epimerase